MKAEKLAALGGVPIRKNFLIFGKPSIEQPEIDEVINSMKAGWIGTGPKVAMFEKNFAKYIGAKNAVALNSCTAALELALRVYEIGDGDEVITTPMTFCATANVVAHTGAKAVFVDVDQRTMNINPDKIEENITEKTKAILPVHLTGRPCDMDKIMAIAQKHKLIVIEDAAHAIETVYHGKKVGTIADITCFSFYVTKNITTGEGGMLTVSDQEIAEKVKVYALHGMDKDAWKRYSDEGFKHYQVIFPGYKYNMMDIQAAMGIHQLARIEKYWEKRNKLWQKYNDAFRGLPLITPQDPEPDTKHAYHLYTLLIDKEKIGVDRDAFQNLLYKENIGSGIHFSALHLHKYYRDTFGYKRGDFPNTEYLSDRTISIPFSAAVSDKDADDVIAAIKKILYYFNPKLSK